EQLGFGAERSAIRAAYQARDLTAMAQAVSDPVLDAFAVAGSADQVRAGLAARARPGQTLVLAPATYGLEADRVSALTHELISMFGQA
ncbi:MAG: hypothetical protein ABJB47_04215, partial [Actinomycetota bacterium]